MFWKKKPATEVPSKPKVEKLSPKEIMINQIEQIGPGQSLTYQLAAYLMDRFAIAELNPEYTGKGRKYIVSSDRMGDGKPAAKKGRIRDSNKAKDIASWVLEKNGVLFSWAEERAINSQVTMLTWEFGRTRRSEMFWKKKPATEEPSKPKVEKLPGPKGIPELVGRHLVVELKQNPDRVWNLKGVVRPRSDGKDRFDFRVFDEAQVGARKVAVKNYTSLDEHPDLILYQGWFDKKAMKVQIEEKKATWTSPNTGGKDEVKMAKKKEKKKKKAQVAKLGSPLQPPKPGKK